MTISLKVRVPKVSDEDIILGIPLPVNPEDITWVWRRKGFRSKDILSVEALDKQTTVVTIWDNVNDEVKRLLAKEPFDDVMLKWEIAESTPALFEDMDPEEEGEGAEEDENSGEDEE